ncbi:hypothetical protein L6R52_15945, partial [Myxococcota bacterium]|nr:hypothetical protein [Myxococcota bacterium]
MKLRALPLLCLGLVACSETIVSQKGPAVLVFGVNRVDFGAVRVGDRATATLELTNPGGRPLEITRVWVEGDPAFDTPTAPETIGEGMTATIELAFIPSRLGDAQAVLHFDSNSASGTPTVMLLGRGVVERTDAGGVPDAGFAPDAETFLDAETIADAGFAPDAETFPDAEPPRDVGFAPDAEPAIDAGPAPMGPSCPAAPMGVGAPVAITVACPGALTLTTPGHYVFTVPAGCGSLAVDAWGAGGGGGGAVTHGLQDPTGAVGGGGAFASSTITTANGRTFEVFVGQGGAGDGCLSPPAGGFPGGGRGGAGSHGDGGGGGGYSGVFENGTARVVAAGGGGGAGHGWGSSGRPGAGGAGG